jgi:isoleucyl-tRNA synthetase
VVAQQDMVQLDRYALIMMRRLQEKVAGELYPRYAFHHATQEIVNFCSEELGAFYLDILKDRLYTTPAKSLARRSAQTALYHITRSLLLLISPILCFTAEEAWEVFTGTDEDSVLYHTWHEFPAMDDEEVAELERKWENIRQVRLAANKEIEVLRIGDKVGSSLQARVEIDAPEELFADLNSLGDELRFVLLVSECEVKPASAFNVAAYALEYEKCERCWHYTPTVGKISEHPTLCARCVENIETKGEERHYA